MLCCVSRKSVEGSGFKRPPLVPPRSVSLTNSAAGKCNVSSASLTDEAKCLTTFLNSNCKLNNIVEEDEPPVLLPCSICGRTFKQQTLDKHTRICEHAAIKKRKPFDSAKQRIRGTELEEFLPKETKRKIFIEEKSTSWKQTHDEFIKTIRAARGDIEVPQSRQLAPIVAPGAPTRSNEKGTCPTCNRQFGIKAYDRHVAWCKERVTRMPSSPATNMAKERLDARMKYRAPALKNRRMTNREKYSSHSKNTINTKTKETVSLPSCIKSAENPVSLKQPAVPVRKIGHGKNDGVMPSGPMKSRLSDRSNNSGLSADYDPFLLAERQMLDLLSDTCSDKSFPDSPITQNKPQSPNYPLTHSSAFVKYPNHINLENLKTDKRGSLIAPPMEFDDLSTGFSSDSTETNSIARELFGERNQTNKSSGGILGRRVIIDKSKALGQVSDVFGEAIDTKCKDDNLNEKNSAKGEKTPKASRPMMNRSNSVRASSAPKIPERNNSNKNNNRSISGTGFNRNNNNYGSNLSLSSIVSSEVEVKRTNSVFEDLVSSFEDDVSGSYPSLRSLLKNDSLSSTIQGNRNGQISDEELSSPDSYNKKDNKLSADSAYSSLNRKYFNGRSTNDVAGKLDEETPIRRRDSDTTHSLKSKMSKFCHECGTKFPETAKFCCECGIQRLTL